MAAEIHQFTRTIPANTPTTALVTIPLGLSNYEIESVDLEVPPGPMGTMGFYVSRSGQQWIPYEAGEFIVWDDRFDNWPLTAQPTGQGWEITGYNLDIYDHDVVMRFHVNPLTVVAATAPPSVTIVTTPLVGATTTL